MALYSIQVEKHSLGGLIQNPHVVSEIDRFLSERDFVAEPHNVMYSCLRSAVLGNERIDKVLLAQKIKNLGISFKDDVNIFDYIEAISFAPITPAATIKACQELVKLRALRDIDSTCDEMKETLGKRLNEPLADTIAEVDGIYGKQMNSFEHDSDPVLLFDGIYEKIEELGNNPLKEVGIATPYPEFNRLYGGFRKKNLYIIASRAKSGKTTWLNETASEISRIHNIPVLILDTEMSTEEIAFRSSTAKSQVGLWHLKSGNWRKNESSVGKVRSTLPNINKVYNKVYHMSVGNKNVQHIASICRRWCLVVYDYLKIVDSSDTRRQEHQEMGDKVDFMKKLAEELDCPVLTACQNNREGVAAARDVSEIVDDERSVGISDRITHFASAVWILRRRTPDEMVLDTLESGSHKLIEIVVREQGRDAAGHQDFIMRRFPDGKQKYVKNFINFHITDFRVEERGSLRDTIARQNSQFLVSDGDANTTPTETL